MRRRLGRIQEADRRWPVTGRADTADRWFDDRAQQLSFTFVHALCAAAGVVFDAVRDVEGRDVILRGRTRPGPAVGTVIPSRQVDVQMKSVRSTLRPPARLPKHVPGRASAHLRYALKRKDYERLRLRPVGDGTTPHILIVVQMSPDPRRWCMPPSHHSLVEWSKIGARGWWVSLVGYPPAAGTGDYVGVFLPRRQGLNVRELQGLLGL